MTDQLLDAALGELRVVALDQPCLIVGDFNVEPTKIPCLSERDFGLGSGLILSLLGHLLLVCLLPLLVSALGVLLVVIVGILWLVALLLRLRLTPCSVQLDRWIVPHHAVRASFLYSSWTCRVSQPVRCTPLWPASWLPALDKGRGSKSIEVQKVWDVYDERLQFMSREDALCLDEALLLGNVSSAWMVWSSAAEKALADAFQFAGGPVPDRLLVLGRGMVRMRTVRLGGPVVRSVRRNAADSGEFDDVSLYRDSSAAPVWHCGGNSRLFWIFWMLLFGVVLL